MGYIIRLSIANIKLRKLRTALTIVGIMIGIMSIVTMLTIGLGAKKSMLEEVEKNGSFKEIQVSSLNKQRKDRIITDSVVKKIGKLDNVDGVYPVIRIQGNAKLSGYMYFGEISGVPVEYMQNLTLKEGELPAKNGSRPELLVGNGIRYFMFNEKTWQLFSDSSKMNDSLVGKRFDYETEKVDNGSPSDAESTESEEGEEEHNYQKLRIVGETDNEYDFNIYTDLDTMKFYLKRQAVDGRIPGQPVDKNDRPYSVWVYDSLYIRVDSVGNVERVSKIVKDMGFEVSNNLENLKSVTTTIGTIQFVLGALGIIAALVAVIGIINTMMTAVYDRVREIGLLKMIGSDSDDISLMFLFESALMGFIGGVLGVGLSLIVDIFINKKMVEFMKLPEETWIMTTPAWLIVGAIAASVLVSVLAGAFPARWAAKIKPLEAIAG
ncbi:MAG: ABC transporter permease [Eubacterium sp.]|nr:ABC transporter permease [Eubacterium sp.]